MKTYHAECPCCGHWNHNLYLEETEGLFECEECGQVSRLMTYHTENAPVLTSDFWHQLEPDSLTFTEVMKKAV